MHASRTLFLTICSNHKITGGSPHYDSSNSMPELLPDFSQDIYDQRNRVRQLIMRGDTMVKGVPLARLPYNARLTQGGDMGAGGASLYLPAMLRYQGRFYTELGADRVRLVRESPHHMLMVSGLYGLVTPEELIQNYTCHILHHPEIVRLWTRQTRLTSLLLAYMRLFGIKQVFDLSGQRAYRDLFDWPRIRKSARVLHVFGEANAGPDLLSALGQATLQWLTESESTLQSLKAGDTWATDLERLALSEAGTPPVGYPIETDENAPGAQVADEREDTLSIIEVEVSARPRDIPITSDEHGTAFGVRVQSAANCPRELRQVLTTISRVVHVTGIQFGRMADAGTKARILLRINPPHPGMGQILGSVKGPFQICSSQDFCIAVTRGQEIPVYRAILRLLNEEDHP
jgi:hypothetical protein